jgi:hypothetical protein
MENPRAAEHVFSQQFFFWQSFRTERQGLLLRLMCCSHGVTFNRETLPRVPGGTRLSPWPPYVVPFTSCYA